MRKAVVVLGALLVVGAALVLALRAVLRPPAVRVPERAGLVLDGVTVIQPGLARESERRVTIVGDRIEAIEPAAPDAPSPHRGMFVLPGLVDMHTHYPSARAVGVRESASLLFLAHGVTTIRDLGALGSDPADTRRRIRAGEFPGPRLFLCGPILDGDPPTFALNTPVASPEAARQIVAGLAAQGVDCIKVYTRISRESLAAIREAATQHGLPLLGHVPADMSLAESGLDDAQHLYGLGESHFVRRMADEWAVWDGVDAAHVKALVAVSLERHIAQTPTLITFAKLSRLRDVAASGEVSRGAAALPLYFADVVWRFGRGQSASYGLTPPDLDRLAAALPRMRALVRELHDAGVQVHLGSDCFMPNVVPGESLIEEMAEFVAAGIPLEDVWTLATRDAGAALGVAGLGRLEPGAPADLLVFRKDPTASLDAMQSLDLVVADGRVYTRAELDAALALHAAHVRSPLYQAVTDSIMRALYPAPSDG